MSDSDIEIVDERPLETVILLDSDNDSDDFVYEADERQEVIELDEPLGKSSNVPSPQSDDINDHDEVLAVTQQAANVTAGGESGQKAEKESITNMKVPEISIDKPLSSPQKKSNDKEYWLSLSSEPNTDNEADVHNKPSSQDEGKGPGEKELIKQSEQPVESPEKAPKEPVESIDLHAKLTEAPDQEEQIVHKDRQDAILRSDDSLGTEGGRESSKKVQKDETFSGSPLKQITNTDTVSTNELVPQDGNIDEATPKAQESSKESSAQQSPTKDSPTKEQTTSSVQPQSTAQLSHEPINDENSPLKSTDQSNNKTNSKSSDKSPSKESTDTLKTSKPPVKEVPKRAKPSIQDDFFSMSFSAPILEPKKKKKKKLKRKLSEEPSTVPAESSSTVTPQDLPKLTTTGSTSSDQTSKENQNEGTPKKKKRLARPLTPPPIDEDIFKEEFAARMNQLNRLTGDDDPAEMLFDEDDQYKHKLAQLEKMKKSFESEKHVSDSNSREDSEEPSNPNTKSRKYILHITSFLPGSQNNALDIDVKGNKKFHAVISKTLSYLLSLGIVPDAFKVLYRVDQITLFWDKVKIQDFMRPDSLRLPEPSSGESTVIELGLYTKSQAEEIERYRLLEREELYRKLAQKEAMEAEAERLEKEEKEREEREKLMFDKEEEDPFKDDELFKNIEADVPTNASREATLQPNNEKEEEGFFKIGLKGEDNKKIIVKVHAETQINKLVEHFINKKGLPPTTKLKLVFDDEDIDLDGTVGDTELEEDFTVDVIVMKK
ncbi:hypothetical protein BN7_3360 [Wickerhamomyces ciferrii]|uniref:Ubiquitin-like domain-containing protein n=1 Tax=Wickerhamomyces ciferrii (strain ATCC 14091 / BCRC 22168 / CBS 111 / JCM 3599 / NBRC 0793 / NRRL Y-1031 F-60-10) TaxID=1206466 RepID=K0KLG1_WICCF|nr:uncharacterized protein BN7_3360 [Wickerhamomyces ciferrii]CCH43806.1 hypothetical protein BN7_3360 [Wickerhamomyces ciferrii]